KWMTAASAGYWRTPNAAPRNAWTAWWPRPWTAAARTTSPWCWCVAPDRHSGRRGLGLADLFGNAPYAVAGDRPDRFQARHVQRHLIRRHLHPRARTRRRRGSHQARRGGGGRLG